MPLHSTWSFDFDGPVVDSHGTHEWLSPRGLQHGNQPEGLSPLPNQKERLRVGAARSAGSERSEHVATTQEVCAESGSRFAAGAEDHRPLIVCQPLYAQHELVGQIVGLPTTQRLHLDRSRQMKRKLQSALGGG